MRVKLILNPAADRGRAIRLREDLIRSAAAYGPLDVALTDGAGSAVKIATEATANGYDVVAAAGGDGTVNEVANGLLREAPNRPAALGLVPIGSGNDYAYGLGLLDPPDVAVHRLFTGEPQPVDVAHIEDERGQRRIVCNAVGIGFDATVAIESLRIKRIYGFAAYLLAALRSLAFRFHTPELQLRFGSKAHQPDTNDEIANQAIVDQEVVDQEVVRQKALLLAVGVGPRVGGGFRLTPEASFSDGLLDSCLARPMSRATMVAMLVRAMGGTHVTSSFVEMRRSRSIELAADRPLPIHVDGEIFATVDDKVRRVTITSLPQALPVVR